MSYCAACHNRHPEGDPCTKDEDQKDELIAALKDHLLACFSQGTHFRPDYQKDPNHWMYDHGCLSAYEDAQDFLIELGLIKPEECYRK